MEQLILHDPTDIQEFIDKTIKFRDWKFICFYNGGFAISIQLTHYPVDNFGGGEKIPIRLEERIHLPISIEELVFILWGMVKDMLVHEAGEQFLVNEKLPYNEHNPTSLEKILYNNVLETT